MSTNPEQQAFRRKLLKWGAFSSIALLFTKLKFLNFNATKSEVISCGPDSPKPKTVKMLTQDGKLVEVDIAKLSGATTKKITDEQLQVWVNKKQV